MSSTGNQFGRDIEFREGTPIQLLKFIESPEDGEFGQIVLNPEALDILQTIREPLAIISVVGSYRRGKSWFANALHGRHDGFDLGAKVEGCTRGIYMWSPPFKLTSKRSDGKTFQKRVIVLDSEGIDDPNQDQNWATKLFILCLVLSSTFIYNINGIVGRDDIGKLYLMTDLSKFIQEPEDGDFLPRLVILLRDFILEAPESFRDYFIQKLHKVNPNAAEGIRKFFIDFDVFGLPHPGCKRDMLQHMEDADTDELDEYFVNGVEDTVKSIYSQLPLKYIGSSTMKGEAFVKFLENIVERMNESETSSLLSIPSEYESIIKFVAQEAIKEATRVYEEKMNLLVNEEGKLPMLWEEFGQIHSECISVANKLFFDKIIGSPTQIQGYDGQLNESISNVREAIERRNSEELTTYNENIAKDLWEKFVKVGLTQENLFENNEKFQEALESFESAYRESMMKSPEANEVIASYMQDQYPNAIDYMTQLGKMSADLANAMRAKEEADKLRLEALAREERFRREIKVQRREREESEKNFNIKILELQSNIEQQKKSNEQMKHRLIEERDLVAEKYNQRLKEIQTSIAEQQRIYEENKTKLIEEQERKFEQIQRSIEEEHRRTNEELRIKLQEKEKAFEKQNDFYQRQLTEQIAENQTNAMLERMRDRELEQDRKFEQIQRSIEEGHRKTSEELRTKLQEEKMNALVYQMQLIERNQNRKLEQMQLTERNQDGKLEQIKRTIEEQEHRKTNEELRTKLQEEKEKVLEQQNNFHHQLLREQMEGNQRETNAILEGIRNKEPTVVRDRERIEIRESDSDSCVIS